jgi:hypothetical protein
MTTTHEPERPEPGRRQFIPGVYNHCDRWCERCRFQRQCRSYHDGKIMEEGERLGLSHDEVFARIAAVDDEEPRRVLTASEQLDWETLLAEVNRPPTREEIAESEKTWERITRIVEADPLRLAARACDKHARAFIKSLAADRQPQSDPLTGAAIEAIGHFAYMLEVKVQRALRGKLEADSDEDWSEGDELQSDWCGTAKLSRLMVRELCGAWEVLRHAGVGGTTPDAMVERLRDLDAALAQRFPMAMSFVRAGWDEQALDEADRI